MEWAIAESDLKDDSETAPAVATAAAAGNEQVEALEPDGKSTTVPLAAVAATVALADLEPNRSNGNKGNGSKPQAAIDPDLVSVGQAFDRMAGHLKVPKVGRQDGRYPVYVIFSVRNRLEVVYSKRIADLLVGEMLALAEAVGRRKGWGARVFMPDDSACMSQLDKAPLRSIDPWELKLALVDLDAALARRGERIGALLIVGGPEIVPFHRLPNPVDDQDDDVPTDNPYATRDENYFIPEWPVGRLPGGMGNDAHVILEALNRIRGVHEISLPRSSWIQRLFGWLRGLFKRPGGSTLQDTTERSKYPAARRYKGRKVSAFGYTAAIWKQAASLVFRPIGKPAGLSVSPPFGFDGTAPGVEDEMQREKSQPCAAGWLISTCMAWWTHPNGTVNAIRSAKVPTRTTRWRCARRTSWYTPRVMAPKMAALRSLRWSSAKPAMVSTSRAVTCKGQSRSVSCRRARWRLSAQPAWLMDRSGRPWLRQTCSAIPSGAYLNEGVPGWRGADPG